MAAPLGSCSVLSYRIKFVQHVVICSVWINCLVLQNTEQTREDPGPKYGCCARLQSQNCSNKEASGKSIFKKIMSYAPLVYFQHVSSPPPLVFSPNGDFREHYWRKMCLKHVLSVCCEYRLQWIDHFAGFHSSVLLCHSKGMTWYNIGGTKCNVLQRDHV